jgi:hypothetical protein
MRSGKLRERTMKNAFDFANHSQVQSNITFKRFVQLSNSIECRSKPLVKLNLILIVNLHFGVWMICNKSVSMSTAQRCGVCGRTVIELKVLPQLSNLGGHICLSTFEFVEFQIGKGEVLK